MQNGWTALGYAVTGGHAEIARLLLENGAILGFEGIVRKIDVTYVPNNHLILQALEFFLHEVIKQGFSEVMSVMLEYGAPVNLIVDVR